MKKNFQNTIKEVLTFMKEVNKEMPKKAIWGMLLLTYVFLVIQSLNYGSMMDKKEKIINDKEIFVLEYKDIIEEYKNVIGNYKFKIDRLNSELKNSKHYSNKMYQKKEEFRKDLIEANNEIIESYNENKDLKKECLERLEIKSDLELETKEFNSFNLENMIL